MSLTSYLVICVVSKKIPSYQLTPFLLGIIVDLKLIIRWWDYLIMLTTNGYKTKIMSFYYIVMNLLLLLFCTNIHSPIYFLCITIMPHHFHTMHFTHSQIMPKIVKNKVSTPFISLFHENFHSYNKLSSNDNVFKCPQKHPCFSQPKIN